MKNRTNNKDIIWGYINIIASMGTNIIILPFIIRFLDSDSLGMWYIFSSIGAFGNIFDFSFAPAFARNIAYAWNGAASLKKEEAIFVEQEETNWYLIRTIIVTCRMIYGIISAAVGITLLTGGTIYISHVSSNAKSFNGLAWYIYIIAIVLNLYFGYYISLLRGVGAITIANQNQVVSRFVQIISTIILVVLGFDLIGACIGYFLNGISYRFLSKYRFYKYKDVEQKLCEHREKVSFDDIKNTLVVVWHNTWREAVVSLSTYIMGQAITIFSSLYLTLSETGLYSLGVQVTTAISQVSNSLNTTFLPEMQAAYITNKKTRIREIISLSTTSFLIIYILGTLLSIIFGIPILHWLKPDVSLSRSILLGLFICQFFNRFPYCYTAYFSATNRINYYKSYSVAALLCILCSYIFLTILDKGVWGLVIAQIASQAFYNFWIWIKRANDELDLSIRDTVVYGNREICRIITKRSDHV